MLGLGIDIMQLSRMRDALETGGEPFRAKSFTGAERMHADTEPDPAARLALVFAAKEAVFKAFATCWDAAMRHIDIEIREGPSGEQTVALKGRFADLATERGITRVLVSLSFDGDYAVAAVALS